ncbi:uncharacterized protein BJX67DRAFT_361749 [Aspergillus lucknowensis]|uniref:Uncharacterized protein n=1 Tax=Aspergillus lucknowensis TaxID=176173 RepID=A0ABR4LIM2_9EURO
MAITNAAFRAIAALFDSSHLPPSSLGSTAAALCETFTASHSLQEIVRHLVEAERTESGDAKNSSRSQIPPAHGRSDNSLQTSPESHQTVLYHFVFACYSLLLLIYAIILRTLSKEAVSRCGFGDSTTSQSLSLDLRLVLLVQVIEYFFETLQEKVTEYTSIVNREPAVTARGPYANLIPHQVTTDKINELEVKVRSGLDQLRGTLEQGSRTT